MKTYRIWRKYLQLYNLIIVESYGNIQGTQHNENMIIRNQRNAKEKFSKLSFYFNYKDKKIKK